MARLVLVHGAFNELWGPHELAARWLPAVRDGLWHHGVTVDKDDVAVCFYGDLFRRDPEADDGAFEQTRAGVAEMLSGLAAACFDGPVEDRLVDNGHRAHDPEPYLNSPVTGAAVARALAG